MLTMPLPSLDENSVASLVRTFLKEQVDSDRTTILERELIEQLVDETFGPEIKNAIRSQLVDNLGSGVYNAFVNTNVYTVAPGARERLSQALATAVPKSATSKFDALRAEHAGLQVQYAYLYAFCQQLLAYAQFIQMRDDARLCEPSRDAGFYFGYPVPYSHALYAVQSPYDMQDLGYNAEIAASDPFGPDASQKLTNAPICIVESLIPGHPGGLLYDMYSPLGGEYYPNGMFREDIEQEAFYRTMEGFYALWVA